VPNRPPPDPTANVDAAIVGDPRPKLLLVSYPTNDTVFGYTVDETVRNLLTIRDAAQAKGTAVIIFSTQPRDLTPEQLAMLPQIDARLSEAVGPCFLPVREALARDDGRLALQYDSGDGIHPNNAGHAVIFDKLDQLIGTGNCVRLAAD
jgi:acyl-CoA thioesterase I